MGMPTQPLLDIMRRSMKNLEVVEAHAGPAGPYELTQLRFLGLFVDLIGHRHKDFGWYERGAA
ncbi:MAG: hypothetical protein EOR73_27830 [Mesorhizobium sp.]|uniref:hypothetical protein n=1 Tax=Mesorhizobium sp. TaxID=1871066 RepID=UPI000FE5BC19|nr:hypothetical protein [Mesorhizobium sp.]RWK45170.1 MAG: hypothetical protein EOR47_32195 [Mesorhizobium sp.]RWM13996.1 MAG: hypothetical protein EOR73_27830 [Mesorhizobium sp.]TIQ13127.1 MAG: hypothetical protein E5X57_10980 [Mesorhizobium sp.]